MTAINILRTITSYCQYPDGGYHKNQLTVSKDEPSNEKHSAYPANAVRRLNFGGHVKDSRPVLTGENLVHSQKSVEHSVKGYWRSIPIIFFWNITTDKLNSEDGAKECE